MGEVLNYYADRVLISELEERGYIVRRREETKSLMWSRTVPIPDDVDFKAEALEKLREQITGDMIRMETRPAAMSAGVGAPEIRRAVLRIL
jgi:hypothetical protein